MPFEWLYRLRIVEPPHVEEMHRLRRDCDFTHVTQNLEQAQHSTPHNTIAQQCTTPYQHSTASENAVSQACCLGMLR